ncbi:MAG TPA: anthranilate phosphoribosyltransferase [Fibrobacteraceae bacterium]|nr:anthranilate phosphoribosyltransferase [Fibrobacteraceae bacterium]
MEYKFLLTKLIKRQDLSDAEASEAFEQILSGQWTEGQIGAFLGALACKGEVVDEVAGAARAMRRKAVRIQSQGQLVMDTCGTGGDGSNTFNISTTAAFVLAGAGVAVAKHGNRSISSLCGSADVLEALGLNLSVPPETMEQALNEIGICFMFAPNYHGAMKYAMPVRKALGVRTMFNMLGPLTNPAAASCQLLGVYRPELTEMFAAVLGKLGVKRALVAYGHDGLDEISVCAPTRVSELKDGVVKTYDLSPENYFGDLADAKDLAGGDAQANAKILTDILSGEKGSKRNVVLLNSGAGLYAAGKVNDIASGIKLAEEIIDSGKAKAKMEELIRFIQGQ